MDKISAPIKQRIIKYIEFKGFEKLKYFETLGVAASNFRSSSLKSEVGGELIAKILSLNSDLSPDWLLIGKEPMIKDKKDTLNEFQSTYDREQKKLIPLYDGVVTAGNYETAVLDPTREPVEMIDAGDWFRDATAAMRVHGDSMYPEYKSGSIAALREVQNKRLVVYGQDYLIETSEYRVIKRLQKSDLPQNWLACSVNEEKYESTGRLIHEPFDVHIDDVTRLYQVLGNVKRNQSSTVIHTSKSNKNN
ncbi:S24 family peptidase [Flavobacterium branchiarum]|uniref:Helix-turn-helix transcriptional regulator n=1 Tax=Flavobacterium branchiarum TaxID=1114870 RepID=A0ABV5FJC5_9FLAO|nr:LexA family transcriptional regulator [Flavobacterium branchiarum]MDN3675705.1 S24 family peptidase [Flavobacterium branchiarum]